MGPRRCLRLLQNPIDPPDSAENLPDCLCPSHKPGPGTAWQNSETWKRGSPLLITVPTTPTREHYYHQRYAARVLAFAADPTGQPHSVQSAGSKVP